MEHLAKAWILEDKDRGNIAEVIRYALSTVRKTGAETYSGIANWSFRQREIDVLEDIYFQLTGEFLEHAYEERLIQHWHTQQMFAPSQLSLATGEYPANNGLHLTAKGAGEK